DCDALIAESCLRMIKDASQFAQILVGMHRHGQSVGQALKLLGLEGGPFEVVEEIPKLGGLLKVQFGVSFAHFSLDRLLHLLALALKELASGGDLKQVLVPRD